MKRAVLIAAFNAAETIESVIRGTKPHVDIVVVVDDGSTDETASIASSLADQVLTHDANMGKGASLITGFSWLCERGFDAAITLDADAQHPPSCIPAFIDKYLETGCDLVIGARPFAFRKMPFLRLLANRLSSFWISIACGRKILDSQCGFRLYKISSVPLESLRARGFGLESEILLQMCRAGKRIETIQVPLIYADGGSHFRSIVDSLRVGRVIARYLFASRRRS